MLLSWELDTSQDSVMDMKWNYKHYESWSDIILDLMWIFFVTNLYNKDCDCR